MSEGFASLGSIVSVGASDLQRMTGATEASKIKQVSKAMEGLFISQLTKEMGDGLEGVGDEKENGIYSDFINKAMTQGVTDGGGLGLAGVIENYLNHRTEKAAPHLPLKTDTRSYHVTSDL